MSPEQAERRATMVRERRQRAETHPSPPGNMLGEQPLVHAGALVRDCRIGMWTEIGPGAVIGAGVTRDVGPYKIAVGAPARTVRTRFTQDVILLLLASEWWEWVRPTLEDRWRYLCDLPRFLDR